LLRARGHQVHLRIVGPVRPDENESILQRAAQNGTGSFVRVVGWVPRDQLEVYLLAADAAVQLRTYARAPLSGALNDCIAFGIPTVTTVSLVTEMQTPSYVTGIADDFDAPMLANALSAVLARPRSDAVAAIEEQRLEWLRPRTADVYARRLLEALGFDGYLNENRRRLD
jgi:glycosyltransferase involved in cell wall biosynthesis